jgi:hypothetical protein
VHSGYLENQNWSGSLGIAQPWAAQYTIFIRQSIHWPKLNANQNRFEKHYPIFPKWEREVVIDGTHITTKIHNEACQSKII